MPWDLPSPSPAPLKALGASTPSNPPSILPAPPPARTDPYGIDLALGNDGDLVVSPSGSVGLVAGADACSQALALRLLTPIGDLPLHPGYGSQLAEMQVGSKLSIDAHVRALNADLRGLLDDDPRFVAAQAFQASTGIPGAVTLGVKAALFGGEQITLSDVSDPSPSDVTGPLATDPTLDPTLAPDELSELEYFADTDELGELNDLNALQSLVDDQPAGGIV